MKNIKDYFTISFILGPRLIVSALLFFALFDQDMGYYRSLRWCVSISALYIAINIILEKKPIYFGIWLIWLFGLIAFLFNPLIPFKLGKDSWKVADVIVGIIYIASTFIKPNGKKTIEIDIDINAVDTFNSGNAKIELKDYYGAIEDYDKAIKLSPKYADAYSKRGLARMMVGNHRGAFEDFEKSIAINPNSSDAYSFRGIAIMEHPQYRKSLEDYNDAIIDYDKAIYINPYSALAYCKRGIAKERSAMQNLSKKYKYNHDNFEIAYHKALENAIKDFNKAIAIIPNYAEAYSERGYTKLNIKDNNGAFEDLSKAIEIDPNVADTYYRRSIVKGILKGYQESIQDINKSIEINPNFAKAYSYRGVCKSKLGDKNGALLDWNKAVELGYSEANDLIKIYCK